MSSSVFTVEAAPVVITGSDEPPAEDGWRSGGLPALRAELDRIDDAMHDLLMQRAEVVEHVGRSGKPAAFRPGREASIIRRLLGRHRGALPPVTLVRIWRELLAGTTAMQGGLSVTVCEGEAGGPLVRLAREHFGALTPLRAHMSPEQALAEVGAGRASVAVMRFPSDLNDWWVAMLHQDPRLYVIGCLPFWQPLSEGLAAVQAVVVASTMPDASEADQSLLGLTCDSHVMKAGLADALAASGLSAEMVATARRDGSPAVDVLAQVEGLLSQDDGRMRRGALQRYRPVVLGGYAVPVAGVAP